MNTRSVLDRIHSAVSGGAYLVPARQLPAPWRQPMADLALSMASANFDAEMAVLRVHSWHEQKRIDRIRMFSALSVIATHPDVRDYCEAARCISMQELLCLEAGGDDRDINLASVERHRGVLAFCMGRGRIALECFIRAWERERSPENLANILAAQLKIGDVIQAEALLQQVRERFPDALRDHLNMLIDVDDDLELLR
ncbi:MAG: hypothetical protein GWP91_11505 [Rhodobacterales bacterium]|nr:hypothetical protein [Rhodobacterales bacterium]